MDEKDMKMELPDDDWVVYIPDEAMRSFNSAYFKMLQAQQELQKMADEMQKNKLSFGSANAESNSEDSVS